MSNWNIEMALSLCRDVEKIAPACGCHVALTGGCLYKGGERKDCDLLFYRIRQAKEINMDLLWKLLESVCDVKKKTGFGWCYKAVAGPLELPVDCFFPEEQTGEYIPEEEQRAIEASIHAALAK